MLNVKKVTAKTIERAGNVHPLSDAELASLQKCLLDISAELDIVCRRHGIKMFLVGGSALGARRHGGFIPWDDDIDFGMSRADYRKFVSIFSDELGDRYFLRCPNTPWPNANRFMQIYKKGTVLRTATGTTAEAPECVKIDIFPYDYVPSNAFLCKLKGYYSNFLMFAASCCCSFHYRENERYLLRSPQGCILYTLKTVAGFFLSFRSYLRWFDRVDRFIASEKETSYVTSATGRKHYLGEIFTADCFFPLTEMEFCGHSFYAPRDIDCYLTGLYGANYMQLPPPEMRERHYILNLKL